MIVNVPRVTATLRVAGASDVVVDPAVVEPVSEPLITAALSQIPFYSFDLQQTGRSPLNRSLPELNTARFS